MCWASSLPRRENGRGFFGVEEEYNDLLAGIKEQVLIPLDPYQMQEIPSAPAGASLILTIDRRHSALHRDVLDKAINSTGADNGTIIVMNPKNGEILAMASTPRMNPTNIGITARSYHWHSLQQSHQPGL